MEFSPISDWAAIQAVPQCWYAAFIPLLSTNSLRDVVHALNDPADAVVRREPVLALENLAITAAALEDALFEAVDVARDLGSDAGLRAQRGNGHDGREHTAELVDARLRGGVAEQRAVVRVQDVHGEIGVRRRQLRDQLLAVRLVDAVPEREAALVQLRNRVGDTGRSGTAHLRGTRRTLPQNCICGGRGGRCPRAALGQLPGARRLDSPLRLLVDVLEHLLGQVRVEGVEVIDRPRNAVEGDTLEPSLAHDARDVDLTLRVVTLGGVVEELTHGVGRVDREQRRGAEREPRLAPDAAALALVPDVVEEGLEGRRRGRGERSALRAGEGDELLQRRGELELRGSAHGDG